MTEAATIATAASREMPVPRPVRQFAADLFSLSQTQRRLAHRYRREALEAELAGSHARYVYCRTESDRLWRDAKRHLQAVRKHV